MEKKSPSHPALVAITGGKSPSPTPSPSPRPVTPSEYAGADPSLMQALRDAQARASLAETDNQSLRIENAELRGENKSLKDQAKLLVNTDIPATVKGITLALLSEYNDLREELESIHARHQQALDAVNIRVEVAEDECRLAKEENQRLLHDLEARLSVESFVEMANKELEDLKLKYDALRSELTERESAESVKALLIEELRELNELLFWDMGTKPSGDVFGLLAIHSLNLLQSENSQRQAFGFNLQSFLFEHQAKKR